jgi:ubiquinone/menaquinone biosynthesis C-methylase UbiE
MQIIQSFMRFFFYHFYHKLSWSYDFIATIVSLGRWNEWGHSITSYIEGHDILELGYGPGYLQEYLIESGYTITGLDESPQMVNRTSNRLRRLGLNSNLVRGIAQALPYPEHFDTVIATFPSEYIFSPQTLSEAYRVLKPGGLFAILLSAAHGNQTLLERCADWLFKVTGQKINAIEDFRNRGKEIFSTTGFTFEIKIDKLRSSTLVFVLARKPERL